jgi:hypothetical protein
MQNGCSDGCPQPSFSRKVAAAEDSRHYIFQIGDDRQSP